MEALRRSTQMNTSKVGTAECADEANVYVAFCEIKQMRIEKRPQIFCKTITVPNQAAGPALLR
jgi:hypothetical protein